MNGGRVLSVTWEPTNTDSGVTSISGREGVKVVGRGAGQGDGLPHSAAGGSAPFEEGGKTRERPQGLWALRRPW